MGALKGAKEYKKFLKGVTLTPKQAIKAQCYICNGEDEGSGIDCQGKSCPLYPFFVKWVLIKRGSGGNRLQGTPNQENEG